MPKILTKAMPTATVAWSEKAEGVVLWRQLQHAPKDTADYDAL